MTCHACRIAIGKRPNIRLSPHVMHLVAHPRRQSRHLTESHSSSRRRTCEVNDKDVDTLDTLTGEVLRRVSGFVLLCCCAVGGVLVEGKELGVFDDGEFISSECGKLGVPDDH